MVLKLTPPLAEKATIAPDMPLPAASVTLTLAVAPVLGIKLALFTPSKEIALILIADVGVEPVLSVVPPPFTGGGNVSLPPPPPQPARASAVVNAES